MQTLLTNLHAHTGEYILHDAHILIENSRIKAIFREKPTGFEQKIVDLNQRHIAAGFIDLHINGGEAHYFTQKPDSEAIADIAEASQKTGTFFTAPCLITSPEANILRGVAAIADFKTQNPDAGVVGMHLEGPFLNPKKRGAHLEKYLQKPTDAVLDRLLEASKNHIALITIAPELFTDAQLDRLLDSGITVSVGHSDATFEEADRAFRRGITLCTHLFNAMTQFQHRAPGVVGAVFDHENVFAPIILDGFHCDYAAARVAYKMKKDKLFLVSDALFLGRKVAKFEWENFDATLIDGQYRNQEGNLAGAAISMADAVRNAVHEVGIPLEDAIKMATVRPAQAIGLDDKIGRITEGMPAKFVAFDADLSVFEPLQF